MNNLTPRQNFEPKNLSVPQTQSSFKPEKTIVSEPSPESQDAATERHRRKYYYRYRLTLELSSRHEDFLNQLCDFHCVSKSDLLRRLIRVAHREMQKPLINSGKGGDR